MCDTVNEKEKVKKVYNEKHLDLIIYHNDMAYFADDFNNHYLAKIDHNFYPIVLWAGSEKEINSVFYRYVVENEIDTSSLSRCE